MIEPRATYRVQFQPEFDLEAGAALVDYLDRLGISHVYASPLARPVAGSTHGYDVVDPGTVNPELGGMAALRALHEALRARTMGLLLDVVPNHVAADAENPWWWSLLADGRHGRGAQVFDVEWDAPGTDGTVVVPLLGEPLEESLRSGAVTLGTRDGRPVVTAPGLELPVADGTRDDRIGDRLGAGAGAGADDGIAVADVAAVLDRQHYRLEFWRTGEQIVNYRRFFDVATLPAVRVEERDVFDAQMALPAALLREGIADGVRIDHVDGLRDPAGFLQWCREIGAGWLLVEKILGPDEQLPEAWDVDGTTGYEFAERAGGVLVDEQGEMPLTELWVELTGDPRPFPQHEEEGRALVLERLFAADRARLARAFARAAGDRPGLDETLTAILAEFTVYRTYVEAGRPAEAVDRERITTAVQRAVANGADAQTAAAIEAVLLRGRDDDADTDARLRFQQLCAAVTAKGVEDTAGYRYARLVARNEVGGEPGRFFWSVDAFHGANAAATRHSRALNLLSTHDSKRAADVRARMAVISEIPDEWRELVRALREPLAAAWAPVDPDPDAEYLLLQTAVGAWPIDRDRLREYALKAAREAKLRTSWRNPDEEFHEALQRVADLLTTGDARADLERVVERIRTAGRVNSLAQVVMQCTAPGVPDVYWGDELWNLTLVDPDNRRPPSPVRIDLLDELRAAGTAPSAAALEDPEDPGRPKLWTLHRCLDLRRRHPEWFGPDAGYTALTVGGPGARHAIAWSRAEDVVAVVPRATLTRPPDWGAATVPVPDGEWRDVFTGAEHRGGAVPVGALLADFPVSVLERR